MLKYFFCTVLFGCLISILYNYNYFDYIKRYFYHKGNSKNVFTSEELGLYDGINRKELYLAILGNVFDVTKGAQHYGPGKTYNVFIGCDASRNFIDGKFNQKDASDDVINLNGKDLLSLHGWMKFYKKEYKKVGVLSGRHYNEDGILTPYGKQVRILIKKAQTMKGDKEELKRKFPPCNVEFDADKGSRVWCTRKSGGIDRDWIGVPRQFYEPGSESHRCACINNENLDLGNIKEYKNCEFTSPSCYIVEK